VRPLDLPLLADENISPDVVAALRERGKDVRSAASDGFSGRSDVDVLRHAHQQGRVVVTHDADFGTLAVNVGEPIVGIIHLRPGHIRPDVVMASRIALDALEVEVTPPFIVVAERRNDQLRVRIRQVR
jgi:predicted nuclease of predicted toxin-antitoxin system